MFSSALQYKSHFRVRGFTLTKSIEVHALLFLFPPIEAHLLREGEVSPHEVKSGDHIWELLLVLIIN